MSSDFIVGLDIGTSSIKVAVAENRGGRPVVHAVFKEPSAGLRKGAIADLAEASSGVARAIHQAKNISKSAIKNIYVNIGTTQMNVQHSRGIVAVSRADSEIYRDDIDRAVKASQAVNIAQNRMIVHYVAQEYVVDGVSDIIDPLGLSGSRLEVNGLIIDAFTPHVKGLIRIIELAGGRVGGLVLTPLAASRSALSKTQKDLGVVLIDIGYGTTGVSVYEENKLAGVAVFPVGAGNITKDLAVALKIPVPAAEQLKLNCGYALAKEMNPRETVNIEKFSPESAGTVSRRYVAEIMEARLAEIFEFVNNELKVMGKAGQLAGGAVVGGGGAKLPGITELVKQELKITSQIGLAIADEWATSPAAFPEVFEDPEYVNALGLVLWGADQEGWRAKEGGFPSYFKPKNILRYFLP